jgi:hypothetical protein
VVPDFIMQASRGGPVAMGDHDPRTRRYCFAGALKGMLRQLRSDSIVTGRIDLRSGEEITIPGLPDASVAVAGSGPRLLCLQYQPKYPSRRRLATSQARRVKGLPPREPDVPARRVAPCPFQRGLEG